ncbi:transposase, partial [Nostoc sp. FACHB-110]
HVEHLWSPSYFACSVGGAPIEVLKSYIKNQNSP